MTVTEINGSQALAFIVNWFVLLFYGESVRPPFFSLLITCT